MSMNSDNASNGQTVETLIPRDSAPGEVALYISAEYTYVLITVPAIVAGMKSMNRKFKIPEL